MVNVCDRCLTPIFHCVAGSNAEHVSHIFNIFLIFGKAENPAHLFLSEGQIFLCVCVFGTNVVCFLFFFGLFCFFCTLLLRLQIRVWTKIPELFSLMVHLSSWQELVWSYL